MKTKTFSRLHRKANSQKCFFTSSFILVLFASLLPSCKKDFTEISTTDSNSNIAVVNSKPNIVLILTDDIGYEVPTIDGGQSYSTPNIDMMANLGMRFTQCYASPMCSPSRFMLLTGKYNFRNYTVWGIMDLSQRTFANMLGSHGYDTYAVGKWQFDGGDVSVRTFGFNSPYVIFEQYADTKLCHDKDPNTRGRYKSPELYANGANMGSITENKYCDDILVDSLTTYASRSVKRGKPFFIYYATSLCHSPYSPTPDDAEYASWDPTKMISNPIFFPSMVGYMDKKIGQVIHRFDSMGLTNNTVFLFLGDNGTPHEIHSVYKGDTIQGGKMETTVWGTHVPLIVYWKGTVVPGSINNDLIDFTDFLPTLAGIARIPIPTTYGILDGVSFAPRLFAQAGTPRDWVFCHYNPEHKGPSQLKRWIQDTTYKLYDSTHRFYNIVLDPYEKQNIKPGQMTPYEKERKAYFQSVMDTLH